jgi:outer membrane protein assembly factor BamB
MLSASNPPASAVVCGAKAVLLVLLLAGGRLYVLGWQGGRDHVRCLEARTGKPLWTVSYPCPPHSRHATGDESAYSGPTSTPEYDGTTGYLYTLSCDGDLNGWDTRAGGETGVGPEPV